MNSYYSATKLDAFNFKNIGKNVKLSRKASVYSPEEISVGNNVRIDDFCILSGSITLGDYIHLAAGTYLFGGDAGIYIDNFSTTSSRVVVYAISDDYSGSSLTNPLIPETFKHLQKDPVYIGRHVIIGTGSVVLPGVRIGDGCAVGAMSMVKGDLPPWTISVGIPAKPVKERKRDLLNLEMEFLKQEPSN